MRINCYRNVNLHPFVTPSRIFVSSVIRFLVDDGEANSSRDIKVFLTDQIKLKGRISIVCLICVSNEEINFES